MTHSITTSVVFLMMHDKLLIAGGRRVFLVSDRWLWKVTVAVVSVFCLCICICVFVTVNAIVDGIVYVHERPLLRCVAVAVAVAGGGGGECGGGCVVLWLYGFVVVCCGVSWL